jgi:hypothetical protein
MELGDIPNSFGTEGVLSEKFAKRSDLRNLDDSVNLLSEPF